MRSSRQLERVVEEIGENPGLIFHTLVEAPLVSRLEEACDTLGLPCQSILEPAFRRYSEFLGNRIPVIPKQRTGPHFDFTDRGTITFANPKSLDRAGNNVDRLKRLHPVLLTLAGGLGEELGKGNKAHWQLRERVDAYKKVIDKDLERIDFSHLYVEGVRLSNIQNEVLSAVRDGDLPSLGASAKETLDSLLQIHGSFMLSTAEGIETLAAEERFKRNLEEENDFRVAAIAFAQSLQNMPEVIEPAAASLVLGAAQQIGKGTNPERSDVVASGAITNVAVTMLTAAALAGLSAAALASGSSVAIVSAGAAAVVIGKGLEKSKSFAGAVSLVASGLDKASETQIVQALRILSTRLAPHLKHLLPIEAQLRQIAGRRSAFAWLHKSLDWLKTIDNK